MKRLKKLYLIIALLFAVLIIFSNLILNKMMRKNEDTSVMLMNQVIHDIEDMLKISGNDDPDYDLLEENGDSDDDSLEISDTDKMKKIIDSCYYEKTDILKKKFGKNNLPDKVYFLAAEPKEDGVALINREKTDSKIWILKKDGINAGFIIFYYKERDLSKYRLILNFSLGIAFIFAVGCCIYINRKVIRPFNRLADYPEKISKNQNIDKLPETKNRMFGKFVWGMNMLNDSLNSERKRVNDLNKEQLTMLTTIAHGIKTPVSNIRLYSYAIETGLYQPDGKPNESDLEVAQKIRKNADDISDLVKQLIDKASGGVIDFEPKKNGFYLSELKNYLDEEYGRRLEVMRIPYEFSLENDAILNSDKDGICRILSQLMENAIKYGNGEGIFVHINKDSELYKISVKNKGEVLSENELPYIFNGFWRGSNAEKTEGSGIGLFEAYEIAKRLDGDIYVRANEKNKEMEFILVIEK
ncbi:HAMP domain-containing sensor histidine kinase [Eubacterium ruminantium]|uniref:HAMP domain-containing sensor histidine kinase n=1 Tax=Eubacterium ruminantium TaxID=42322 RepID=UPI001569A82B|nr:HAMP domain-containing sensor histidine kinase [Eubacterium ruminantium]